MTRSPPVTETREKILDAARELFVTQGFERATMRRIADAIGYTPTTIYLYFKDKESLLRELAERDFTALAFSLSTIAQIDDPVERLRRMGVAYTEFGLAHPNQYRFMFMTEQFPVVRNETSLECAEGPPERDAYAFLTRTVAACIQSGRLRPVYHIVEQVAQMVWGAIHGIISLYVARQHVPWIPWHPPADTAAMLIDTLVHGMLADGADIGTASHVAHREAR